MGTVVVRSHSAGMWRRLAAVALGLSVLATVLGALAPPPVMGWLRMHVPYFALMWDWLDATFPALNPLHVIAYAWITLCWCLVLPHGRRWLMVGSLLLIGASSEALQFLVPGRQPRLSDVWSDALGIAIGGLLAWLVARALRHRRSRP